MQPGCQILQARSCVAYHHQFEAPDAKHTRLSFVIAAIGFGACLRGPPFALLYRPSLDRAIPRLVNEVNGNGAGV